MAEIHSQGNNEAFISKAGALRDFYVVEKIYIAGRSTVYIDYPTSSEDMSERGGTGVLLPNGWILTCKHVIQNQSQANKAIIYFDYCRDKDGSIPSQWSGLKLDPDLGFITQEGGLDWVLVKLKDHRPEEFPVYVFPPDNLPPYQGQKLTIFQHPNKLYLKFGEGTCSSTSEDKICYAINTDYGSSGGPVLNDFGDLVAIHTSDKDSANNQGLPLKAIIKQLKELNLNAWEEMQKYASSYPISHASVREKMPQYNNLPAVPSLFKGRDNDIRKIHAALTEPNDGANLYVGCVVYGLGGIGKTRAVVEYAKRYKDYYSSIVFVNAKSVGDFKANLANLCDVLGLKEPDEPPQRYSRVIRWLQEQFGWLLIIDNIDDAQTAIEVQNSLANLSNGKSLLTSRMSGWKGSFFRPVELLRIDREYSIEIVLEGTEGDRKNTTADRTNAENLAERLGDLPLALQQAVGFISTRHCSFEEYLNRWDSAEKKVVEWHDELKLMYPRSIATTWELSFDEMKPEGKQALRLICWLAPDPIPKALLHRVAQVPNSFNMEEGIEELEKYSFLRWVDDKKELVQVHALVSEIARYRMSEEERRETIGIALATMEMFVENQDPSDPHTWPSVYKPCRAHLLQLIDKSDEMGIGDPTANLINKLALFFLGIAGFEEAEPLFRRALEIDEASYGPNHPSVAAGLNHLARLLHETNRHGEAKPLYRRALEILEASYGPNHPNVATVLNNLAGLLQKTNRHGEAEPLYRLALEIDEASYGPNHPNVAALLNNLARLLLETNRHSEAEPLTRRALEIYEASSDPNHPRVATVLNNIARLLQETNRHSEAEPLFRRALEIDEASYGPNHPNVAAGLNNIARLLQETNRHSEAEPLFRRALEILEASYGSNHPSVAAVLNNLARLLQDTNRHSEAEPLFRRAIEIVEASYGPNHPNVVAVLNNLALLLKETNRHSEAEPLFRHALEINEASYGPNHPHVATGLTNLAVLLYQTDRHSEAEPLFRRALQILEASYGPDQPNTVTLQNSLTHVLNLIEGKSESS
jgi:tetratricopeptide (TPR) repeat protein